MLVCVGFLCVSNVADELSIFIFACVVFGSFDSADCRTGSREPELVRYFSIGMGSLGLAELSSCGLFTCRGVNIPSGQHLGVPRIWLL